MKRSTDGILTTHTGSLPRPPALTAALQRRDKGDGVTDDLDGLIREGVLDVVRRQREAGVSVVNDGEASKISYATYIKERLDGFGGQSAPRAPSPDVEEFPEYVGSVSRPGAPTSACIAPLAYGDLDAVRSDIANLKNALAHAGDGIEDAFMSAASPGVISARFEN